MCCIREIQSFVQSVFEKDMDYIQCNEVLKSSFFSKTNESFQYLMKHCTEKYKEYSLEQGKGDRSFVWIWAKSKECREYIKQYIENDIKQNYDYKYIALNDEKISILFGRPHNDKKDMNGTTKRYNEWSNMFEWNDENKKFCFWNKDGKKCQFAYKYVNDSKKLNHQICVIVKFKDYDNISDALKKKKLS